jgi:zinc finger CCCH domain-containing protein 13
VRIVDPPTEEEEKKPKGILKKPKEKFPDYPDEVREGVAPLKDVRLLFAISKVYRANKL